MTVEQIAGLLKAELLCGEHFKDKEVSCGCGSDLMSDVLAFSKTRMCLLTGLTNVHVLRTANVLDVVTIILVRGKYPSDEMLELAQEMDLALLRTDYTLFEACGILYAAGLPGKLTED